MLQQHDHISRGMTPLWNQPLVVSLWAEPAVGSLNKAGLSRTLNDLGSY